MAIGQDRIESNQSFIAVYFCGLLCFAWLQHIPVSFIDLLYALRWLNFTPNKCTFYRKSCGDLTLKQHTQIWSTDKVLYAWLM